MGIWRTVCCQGIGQSIERGGLGIEIDILQQDDIGTCGNDHRDSGGNLRIIATPQITQQKPRPGAAELGMEIGKPHDICPGSGGGYEQK
jgi:hypothetical protein